MSKTRALVVLGVIASIGACGGEPIVGESSANVGDSTGPETSSSRQQNDAFLEQSSSSSSSLSIGECPPDFDFSPEVAVMDIELNVDGDTFVWNQFSMPVIMPRVEVAQQKAENMRSKWAISFNLLPKAHACTLPLVTLDSYVQSFEVKAKLEDTTVSLTPYMASTNTGENGRFIAVDDAGVSYPLSEWNGFSKVTELGVGFSNYFTEDTELTLSFASKPPIIGLPVLLEVEATFNDGTVITRTSGLLTFTE